jgi:5-methylcytosine-specific restriction endonuclease McrA
MMFFCVTCRGPISEKRLHRGGCTCSDECARILKLRRLRIKGRERCRKCGRTFRFGTEPKVKYRNRDGSIAKKKPHMPIPEPRIKRKRGRPKKIRIEIIKPIKPVPVSLKKIRAANFDGRTDICGWCFQRVADSVDHMVPRAYKTLGANRPSNLMPSCMRCNLIASDKVFDSIEEKRAYIVAQLRRRGEYIEITDLENLGISQERSNWVS